jgi:FAD/FMN-containing dehydrogenase
VLPSDAGYSTAKRLWDPRWDAINPAAIAYCASNADVQRCLQIARTSAVTPRSRSGGHSYGGWSTGSGLVVDVTRMAGVQVSADGRAVVGAGTRLIDVYEGLAKAGWALPAGSCPTVGIAGLTLGGGVGVLGRAYGLTSDRLETVDVVTSDGTLHHCTANADADLFWACRGGGGGNVGVATSFTFSTVPAPAISTFSLSWPWAAAAEVLAGWQSWAPSAPDEIWSTLLLLARPAADPGTPIVRVNGAFVGSANGANTLVDEFVRTVGSAPDSRYLSTPPSYLDAMLVEAGCAGQSVASCHLPDQSPGGTLTRKPLIAASDYLTSPLSEAGIATVVRFVQDRQNDPLVGEGGAQFDAYGGAINRVRPDATSFVHRGTLAGIQRTSSFSPGDSQATIDRGYAWLREFSAAMRPYVSGSAYQNYADPDLADWASAYYGSNLARLRDVKKRFDPERLFDFPQAY